MVKPKQQRGRPKTKGLDPSDKPKVEETKNVGQDPDKEKAVEEPAANNNLIGQGNRQLKGMKDICQYVNFSESTVLGWIRERNFPATKTTEPAGVWVSTTRKVDKWREVFFG